MELILPREWCHVTTHLSRTLSASAAVFIKYLITHTSHLAALEASRQLMHAVAAPVHAEGEGAAADEKGHQALAPWR